MNLLCEFTIINPRLPCFFRMANDVSSTVEQVNSVTSYSINSFNFAMWAFASTCLPMELVPCSDWWRRTWWQTMHMIPGLLVSSIPQCKSYYHGDACVVLFRGIGRFVPTFIAAHHTSKMICNVSLLKSWIKTCSFLEEIITSSIEVFKDFESDMAIGIRPFGIATWETAHSNVIVKQNVDS